MVKKIALTGDRPTGKLHLGHFCGSLQNRIKFQDLYEQFVMIADVQALTDNFENPKKVSANVFEVALDYLAVGIDPAKTTIFIQSMIPQIAELTVLFMNLVTVARLERNPTVKEEIKSKGFERSLPLGFLAYPVSQTADITFIGAEFVPVGNDQLPMIEQTCEIVDRFNNIYGPTLVRPQAVVPEIGARLPGIDGNKMSKSLNNAIYLSDEAVDIKEKVMRMYTDPEHLRVEDPGKVEGNVVFSFLDIFATDKNLVEQLKVDYQRGGLGDVKLKKMLIEILESFISPVRERRKQFASDPSEIFKIIQAGTTKTLARAEIIMQKVRAAIGINYF